MRTGRRLPFAGELSCVALALTLAGCSTSGENSFSTASLAPRPEEGMRRDPIRTYTAETETPRPYTQPAYTPPPPAYQTASQHSSPYSRPYGYGAPSTAYGAPASTSPYSAPPYGTPAPRAQPYAQSPYAQPAYPQASGLTTASVGAQPSMMGQAPMSPPMQHPPMQPPAAYAPLTTGSLPRETSVPLSNSGVYVVRQGDTLYGISKRTGVPVQDLASANKILNNKISIGQKLNVPQKHAAK